MAQNNLDNLIDKALDKVENAELSAEEFCRQLLSEHPVVFNYLFSKDYQILSDEEGDYALFLNSILLETLRSWKGIKANVNMDDLELAEEEYWSVIEDQKTGTKGEDPYEASLPDSVPEELVWFILDALDEQEIDFITPAGKPFIFVKLAALVTVLTRD